MVEVFEFKGIDDLRNYLKGRVFMNNYHIIPVARMFENPETHVLLNVLTYVLIVE